MKGFEHLLSEMHKPPGLRELEFTYETHTQGLPKFLTCCVTYEHTDESFDTHGASGVLETQVRTGVEIMNLEVWSKGKIINPESLEPGLGQWLEKEALERIQDLN